MDTLSKPDFQRIKELKALINGIFMKEGEVNIWLGRAESRASKCINNCCDDSQRSHGSHTAERLFERSNWLEPTVEEISRTCQLS